MKGCREVSGVESSDVQAEAKVREKRQWREVRRFRRLVSHRVDIPLSYVIAMSTAHRQALLTHRGRPSVDPLGRLTWCSRAAKTR